MASSLLNGERAVVASFIITILYATPLSLISEALSLSIITLLALVVEISAESSTSLAQFKTRPGVSSGVLIGGVTLPGVMISRLIQLSRSLSLPEVGLQELEDQRLQYWATYVCCFSVIAFIGFILYKPFNNEHPVFLQKGCLDKFSLCFFVFYAAVGCVILTTNSYTGWFSSRKLLWVLCQGLAAVTLIQHVIRTFPFCFSIGEALLVTTGLVIYVGDMVALTFTKGGLIYGQYGIKRSEIGVFIQGMVLGLLLFPMFFKFVLQICERVTSWAFFNSRPWQEHGNTSVFYSSLALISFAAIPSWMQLVHDFGMHPFFWVFAFVFSEPLKRLTLCIYWVTLTYVSVRQFYQISKSSKTERILLRKYYHLMAVLMFVPALLFQPKFLNLAFGAALAVFLLLEIIRVWRIWPLGHLVHQFMNAFTDHRDSDLLIVSHFSLLLGCALPIWMSSAFNDRPLVPFAGILSLGIGDTMASMIGHKYGTLRWSKTGKKTIEGTAAGITSVLAACSVLLPLLTMTGHISTQHWFSIVIAVTLSGLLEAYTAQLDNAFIPLVFYSLLCL